MIRLTWRQFRVDAIVSIAFLAALAAVLLATGPHLLAVYRTSPSQVTNTDTGLQTGLLVLSLVAPALAGVFFGAPLIAGELESGTFRLAWTQGVTRGRWLLVKLGLVGAASSVLAGGLSLMVAWWANPINIEAANRFSPTLFGAFGIVPFAYALFAFALGAMTGLLFRRTLPAMATTAAAFVGVRLAVTYWVRPSFEAPLKKIVKLGPNAFGGFMKTPTGVKVVPPNLNIPNAWVLSTTLADKSGNPPSNAFFNRACPTLASGAHGAVQGVHARGAKGAVAAQGAFQHCVAAISASFHGVVRYQPASRYWPFQAYETALFVFLALVLAGVSYWWVKRRLSAG